MTVGTRHRSWTVVALLTALLGCTDAFIEPTASEENNLDNKLSLTGRVCTSPPDATGFPVKVVIIVDQSGSMCVSDPPGSQEGSGFCEQAAVKAIVPPGVTSPARVRALQKLLAQFAGQPNVQVSIVPFETNIKKVWPADFSSGSRFARPDSSLTSYAADLQSQLGKGTDYQGALSKAYELMATDMADVSDHNPELLPRSKYVVVFLTDGTPFPRCAANDNLPPEAYASPEKPDLTWADSSGAGDFCNIMEPTDKDAILGYEKGTDRNQNYQLFSYVDRMMDLKSQYNVGSVRLHTVLLFNQAAVAACGSICSDIYGTYAGVPQSDYPAAAKKIAEWLLGEFARRGNGQFQEFSNGEIYNMGLGALDYASLASRNVKKELFVQAMTSVPGLAAREVDSDGDGLADALDNSFTHGTNPFFADSDEDCFDDEFEVRGEDRGFLANAKDSRGCDKDSPLTPNCVCRDTDGDGLSQFGEAYLKTRPGLVDADGDGIPDGIEARFGLDPRSPSAGAEDTDGDGLSDLDEVRSNSNPIRRDKAFYDNFGYQYETVEELQANGSVCYNFTVSNLSLVTPPSRAGVRQGYNLFKVYFAEAPQSGVATDYGVWRTGCAFAQYDAPSIRVPLGPDVVMSDSDFFAPSQLVGEMDAYKTLCAGTPP